ncbi:flagellar assembly factor FliW [bacterium BMS3Bbin06]|nr:flagellar assembly factor FliW [bacterium BMS3Abin08]GBE35138.1 flagellar assembly factor FliW [bacterium BMS3Bbin06]HDO36464.1 flagellar assembly protein FliW [Nitrospirota bacterium]
MTTVNTSRFGELEVSEDRIVHFPEGLIGFPRLKRYMLLDYKDTSIQWLQAVDDPDVAFIVATPFLISSGYQFDLPDSAKEVLSAEDPSGLVVLVILRVEDEKRVIANFHGPLVLNSKNMTGIQLALEDKSINQYTGVVDLA